MDEREQKGLYIAATSKIEKRGAETWMVPSQSLNGRYAVTITSEGKFCNCPDWELRRENCKHIHAVQYTLFRESVTETKPDGTVQTTTTEAATVKVTYAQPSWATYNQAQVVEKEHFCRLLRDLVANVATPPQEGCGRRRLPFPDLIFGAAYKVYSQFSGRRFQTDLRAACEQGLVSRAPAYNSIFEGMQLESLTPILHDLITKSSLPLALCETQFAVDSTGFGTSRFFRYYNAKYKHEQINRDWVKCHAMVGTKTNIITAVKITDRDAYDGPQLPELVKHTAQNFNVEEVSADKAYSSRKCLQAITDLGATPFVPFKINAVGNSDSPLWNKLYHFFHFKREEFLAHYHRRSNVETTFSMVKRVLGDSLMSRTPIAQTNEALLKIICHNIRVLIHEMHELGISQTLIAACPASTREHMQH